MKVTGNSLRNNVTLLKHMDEIVVRLNDERAYEHWILVVPDGANDDDFEFIAGDTDEMHYACGLFRRIIECYGKTGWCTATIEEDGDFGPLVAYGEDKEDEQ